MAPRGRPKRKHTPISESGTSITESEEVEPSSSSSRPRRSRLPKRYFDEDYSPPPAKKRAAQRSSPSDNGEEEALKIEIAAQTPKMTSAANKNTGKSATKTPRGRPRKNATPPNVSTSRRKSLKKTEEVIYMDEDSDEDEESSDEEFVLRDEQEEIEEELNLNDIKLEKEDDEDTYCPWLDADPETLPKLEIPESSRDIPLPDQSILDAVEVYEILRSYHRTLRITPFTFEDFCAALMSENNSSIMAEVHMALLRVGMKSDEEEQTHYSVTDTNQSINIMIHHMDTLTYGEVLRQYIEAYPLVDTSVREAINVENYPYVGYEPKLVVLMFMSYRFLYSSEYKKVVNNVGKFQNDENCRVCGKSSGQVIGCTQCEAAFHVDCSHLKPFPEVLVCNICKRNSVHGVYGETVPFGESLDREPLRSQPVGRDRYGRYYWFFARRLFVQSLDESEIHYYTTPLQLYQLLQKLDRNYYEKKLCSAIHDRIDEFLEQMTLTVEMTSERREASIESSMKITSQSYEYTESKTPQIYLHKDSMKRMASILRDCSEKVIKEEVKSEICDADDDEATRSSGPLESTKSYIEDTILPESMLGIFDGRLINTFWSGGATQEELVQYYLHHMSEKFNPMSLWRMGDERYDQTFMQYYNYYGRNEMAESMTVRKKIADKKKYMASKFSNLDEFIWLLGKDRQFYGNSTLHTKVIGWTLSKIARQIPSDLMHRRWPEEAKNFDVDSSTADTPKKLAVCLLQLDAFIRKTVFIPQWWNGLGQTKMQRITVEQRESFVKEQQKIKKMELDALAKDLDESFTRVNYLKPKWPNMAILRQRGETYRNGCKGTKMGGWAWVARKYNERRVPVPEAPKLPLTEAAEDIKKESSSNRKVRRLELLVSKIKKNQSKKNVSTESATSNFELINRCYVPGCSSTTPNPMCYSPSCRYGYLAQARQAYEEKKNARKAVLGEDLPWPIPEIQTFSTKRGGRSLFVLQKKILRRLIVTGGCSQVYMPGFQPSIKSNLLIWPYPAPRPTLDLCWKWQTLTARGLHAVALQLKIMWSSIKWNEFDPEDSHPDRRVVIDTPTHDERRRIIRHKEEPPYGQYERYELEIEIIPLYDEQEEEDESWTSRRDRSADCSQRSTSTRKKRPGHRGIDNRQATSIRNEWVDGVTLKAFEIKDYWKWVRMESEKAQRRKLDAARKAAKIREEEEKKRQLALQKTAPPIPTVQRTQSDRINTPYMGAGPRRPVVEGNGNTRFLEMYNTSQIPPRNPTGSVAPSPVYSTPISQQPMVRQVVTNMIRKTPDYRQQAPQMYAQQYQQHPSTSRAAAGADGVVSSTYRAIVMTPGASASQQYRQQYQSQVPIRHTSNGYQFPDGTIRGGGRANPTVHSLPRPHVVQNQTNRRPFGDQAIEMRRVMPVGEEAVAANAVGSDGDEQPPVIPRYDHNTADTQNPQQPRQQTVRHVYSTPNGQQFVRTVPGASQSISGQGGKSVIFLKSADGNTQKMVLRPAGAQSSVMVDQQQQVYRTQDYPAGTVLPGGARLVAVRPGQSQQQSRQVYASGNPPRFSRVPNNSGGQRVQEQIVRRVVQTGPPRQMFQEYGDDQGAPPQMRYVLQNNTGPPAKMSRVLPRGGLTMQMVQQQQHPEHRRMLAGRQKQKVTTYRDFMASRGYLDASKFMMQTKPTFLPFEFNEEEEREINEAIAREEEWMRLEEENKINSYDPIGNPLRSLNQSTETHRVPPYVSNLLPSPNDTADDKVIKQVLDVMFSQVCRWDRQYGWSKTHLKRAKQKNDSEKLHLRKFRTNQREMLISEHMERLKKEINKRRTKMENEAEQQCGLLTPWRKSRSRPHRTAKPKAEVKKEVINPADITLGGDTYDYAKSEQKPTETIASGVARRRRTSANLSKSEEDQEKPESTSKPPTTRGKKERRTSEPSRVIFYSPGAIIDIDAGIAHCICQKMFDAAKFYVQCDMCARWYHGDCVDMNERKVIQMEHWTCSQCIEEQEKVKERPALYCVCRKPYDDTKFYVGCDSCQGWFHPECVGTTREESEQAAEYNCPECIRRGYESEASDASVSSRVSVQLSRADYAHVLELLELLVEHRMSTPFRKPVDLSEFPDYEQYIKKPMDLSIINHKVECTEYLYLSEFVNDVNLMFENAKTYNPKDHAVFKCAETMQEVFDKKLIEIREKMALRQQQLLLQQHHGDLMSSARKRVQSESQKTVDSLDIDPDQLLPLDDKIMGLFFQ